MVFWERMGMAGTDGGLPQSDLDAFDRVIKAYAERIQYGELVVTVSGGLVKDLRASPRAHLGPTEKPSSALQRVMLLESSSG